MTSDPQQAQSLLRQVAENAGAHPPLLSLDLACSSTSAEADARHREMALLKLGELHRDQKCLVPLSYQSLSSHAITGTPLRSLMSSSCRETCPSRKRRRRNSFARSSTSSPAYRAVERCDHYRHHRHIKSSFSRRPKSRSPRRTSSGRRRRSASSSSSHSRHVWPLCALMTLVGS